MGILTGAAPWGTTSEAQHCGVRVGGTVCTKIIQQVTKQINKQMTVTSPGGGRLDEMDKFLERHKLPKLTQDRQPE